MKVRKRALTVQYGVKLLLLPQRRRIEMAMREFYQGS
jgi:hypothetical protein